MKNKISDEQYPKLIIAFQQEMLSYQVDWHAEGILYRNRNIIKSRRIGANYYFAKEALYDAMTTGKNQVFISNSKAQANIFKQYIIQFADSAANVKLQGDPIILKNGAHIYFYGEESKNFSGIHGNVYVDEYFYLKNFKNILSIASGIAAQKKYKKTFFSTLSRENEDAYHFLNNTSFAKTVTIDDAIKGGCHFINREELKRELSADEFNLFYMCQPPKNKPLTSW